MKTGAQASEPMVTKLVKPSDLPAPPQAAIQIVHACSDDKTNSKRLAQLTASDPVITAEILRVANTPFFGYGKKIQSIPRAVTVMGQRALRSLVLCVAVRDALKEDAIPGFDIASYWEESLRHAVCARLLGKDAWLDVDECFTVGLLQDFGLLVMFFLNPERAGMWPELRHKDPVARLELEQKTFNITHDKVGAMLAKQWGLPDGLAEALGNHHSPVAENIDRKKAGLADLARCADWMAAVFSTDDKTKTLQHCRNLVAKTFGLDPQLVDRHLAMVPEQVEEAASALGLRIGEQLQFDEIMRNANRKLADDNLSYQELTRELETALKERDRLAAELNREIELAQEIQQSLLPAKDAAGAHVIGINVPARELSGDFYDYFTLDDGHIYFNLGDVSGKGINAALLMAKTSSLFRCLGKKIRDPAELLKQINAELCETTTRGMFVTITAGLYNPATGSVRLVNAGNPPALLIGKHDNHQVLKADSPPLGIDIDTDFVENEFELSGRSLYLFSDGVTEGHIARNEMLGIKGLLNMIIKVNTLPPQRRLDTIVDCFRKSPEPLRDDTTMLLLEHNDGNGKPAG